MDSNTPQNILKYQWEQENPETYAEGMSILVKLLNNIALNPIEDKFCHLKLSNKTLNQKLFSLAKMKDLLISIGWRLNLEEYYLPQANLGQLLSNLQDIRHASDRAAARLQGEEELAKVERVIQEQQSWTKKEESDEARKHQIEREFENDKKERKLEKAKDSVAKPLNFGANVKRCEDIGIKPSQGG